MVDINQDLTSGKLAAAEQNQIGNFGGGGNILQNIGQGIGDFFNSPFFKGRSVIDTENGLVTNNPSGLNQLLGVGNFALGIEEFKTQKDFLENQQAQVEKQNRQNILAQLENANRAMGSREYNRLRMQGLSDEDARANAEKFVAERGLKPETFGVKPFTNNVEQADPNAGQSPILPENR